MTLHDPNCYICCQCYRFYSLQADHCPGHIDLDCKHEACSDCGLAVLRPGEFTIKRRVQSHRLGKLRG